MEMYQDVQSEKKTGLWGYILLLVVVGAIVFLFIRYKNNPGEISENEKEQILNDLRDARERGPAVELTEEQKTQILNDLRSLRSQAPETLSEEEKAEILSQLQNN